MPIKNGAVAYEFMKEFLDLMKTGKDNIDKTFRKKSEWLKKEDANLYDYIMIAFLDAKNKGKTPRTPEELSTYAKKMLEAYVNMPLKEIIKTYNDEHQN